MFQGPLAAQPDVIVVFSLHHVLQQPDYGRVRVFDEFIDCLHAHAGVLIPQQHLCQRAPHLRGRRERLKAFERLETHSRVCIVYHGIE